jgi:hypothetical protein
MLYWNYINILMDTCDERKRCHSFGQPLTNNCFINVCGCRLAVCVLTNLQKSPRPIQSTTAPSVHQRTTGARAPKPNRRRRHRCTLRLVDP